MVSAIFMMRSSLQITSEHAGEYMTRGRIYRDGWLDCHQ